MIGKDRNFARLKSKALALPLLACAAVLGTVAAFAQTDAQLVKPDPSNWVTWSGNYNSSAHSALKQVTVANAKNLVSKWAYHVPGTSNLEATPIVYNGIMYISGVNQMDAIDAKSGNVIWRYRRAPASMTPQRGTAIYNGKLYIPTSDQHIVALDARTGRVVWDEPIAPGTQLNGAAPYAAKGKLIVGGSGNGGGTISAYDAETGKNLWVWHSLPAAGEPWYDSWGGKVDPRKLGGANVWRSGSYDPELNLYFSGTGSPPSLYSGGNRPGDDLCVDCIVALDIDTGKLKWYFQANPHEVHDWDEHESLVLVDTVYQGKPRKLLIQAARNGFYYVLDRTTGEFLTGKPFINIDWATGLNAQGHPIEVPGHEPSLQGTKTCPGSAGGTNWPASTYSPQTGYLYVQSLEGCAIYIRASSAPDAGGSYVEDDTAQGTWQSYLRALDAKTGNKIWEYKEVRSNHYAAGVLSTDGGVVFVPEQRGQVTMLDAKNGKILWHYNVGDLITAGSVTYAVDGQQYFAVVANDHVFAFGLQNSK